VNPVLVLDKIDKMQQDVHGFDLEFLDLRLERLCTKRPRRIGGKNYFSRKGAKTQRKTSKNAAALCVFAPLRKKYPRQKPLFVLIHPAFTGSQHKPIRTSKIALLLWKNPFLPVLPPICPTRNLHICDR